MPENIRETHSIVWHNFCDRPYAGAQTVINRFIEMKILTPKDADKKYGQSYIYKTYTDIFDE